MRSEVETVFVITWNPEFSFSGEPFFWFPQSHFGAISVPPGRCADTFVRVPFLLQGDVVEILARDWSRSVTSVFFFSSPIKKKVPMGFYSDGTRDFILRYLSSSLIYLSPINQK